LINDSYPKWLQGFDDVTDKRVLWDLTKYKVRRESMRGSKMVSGNLKKELNEIEAKVEHFENLCASDPCEENITVLESVKVKYEQLYEHIVQSIHTYIRNCRQYCFGLLGLISAVLKV